MEYSGSEEEIETASHSSKRSCRPKRVAKNITLEYLVCEICSSQETCIEWMQSQGFIPKTMVCPSCGKKMVFEEEEGTMDGFAWICKECPVDPPKFSARHGTWLERRKDDCLVDILLLCFYWANGFKQMQMVKEANVGEEDVEEWDAMCTEMCDALILRDEDGQNGSSKASSVIAWRKKNRHKDPFLELLKDASTL